MLFILFRQKNVYASASRKFSKQIEVTLLPNSQEPTLFLSYSQNSGHTAALHFHNIFWPRSAPFFFVASHVCLCCNLGMAFCYQNSSDLLWEKIVLVIAKKFWNSSLKAENLQKKLEITRTICSYSERSEQFLVTECFFNLFLEFSEIWYIRTIR